MIPSVFAQTLPAALAETLIRQGAVAPPSVSLTSSSGGTGYQYLETRLPTPSAAVAAATLPAPSVYERSDTFR